MSDEMEKLAGIDPGDSNEVCLAKTMLAIDGKWSWDSVDGGVISELVEAGVIYAREVLNARDEPQDFLSDKDEALARYADVIQIACPDCPVQPNQLCDTPAVWVHAARFMKVRFP